MRLPSDDVPRLTEPGGDGAVAKTIVETPKTMADDALARVTSPDRSPVSPATPSASRTRPPPSRRLVASFGCLLRPSYRQNDNPSPSPPSGYGMIQIIGATRRSSYVG